MGLIKSTPTHDRSDRDWNQRTVLVEHALQCSLGRNSHLATELS